MPFPFQVILIAGATGYLLTAMQFLMARTMPNTNPGTLWWSVSSLAAGLGYILLLSYGMNGDPQSGEALYNILFIVWAISLYFGSMQFIGIEHKKLLLISIASIISLILIYFYFIEYSFLPAALAVSLFVGLLNLRLAWLLYKNIEQHSAYTYVLISAITISGLHWLDYPFLRPVEAFAPIGFSICAIVSVFINSMFAGMVLRQFRLRMTRAQQVALYAANHDSLTGLTNRMALESQFELYLAQTKRDNGELVFIFIDLNDFKPVNDKYGHIAGDKMLQHVAAQIKTVVKESDIVSRIGGDEFAVVINSKDKIDTDDIDKQIDKILNAISQPMKYNSDNINVTASIGYAKAPSDSQELSTLINLADEAMYNDKKKNKSSLNDV